MADAQVDVEMDGPIWMKVGMTIADHTPEDILTWFTVSDRLVRWWGEENEIELIAGGNYLVMWPSMNWTMRGQVIRHTERELVYSWSWDHEPSAPPRVVMVRTSCQGNRGSSRLTIVHGPYRPTAPDLLTEEAERIGHRDGWLFFLPKLHAAMMAEPVAVR